MSDIVVKDGTSVRVTLVNGAEFSGSVTAGKFVNHGFIAIKKSVHSGTPNGPTKLHSRITLVPLSQISYIEIDDGAVVRFEGVERSEPQKRAIAAAYAAKNKKTAEGGSK